MTKKLIHARGERVREREKKIIIILTTLFKYIK